MSDPTEKGNAVKALEAFAAVEVLLQRLSQKIHAIRRVSSCAVDENDLVTLGDIPHWVQSAIAALDVGLSPDPGEEEE